jgi:hypothetical protein
MLSNTLSLRRNHRQHNIIPMLLTEVQIVQTSKLLLAAILRVIVPKDARTLRVAARDLQHKLAALLNYHIRRPNLDVDFIDSIGLDLLHVGAAILAVRQPLSVPRVLLVDFAQTRAEPAFGQRHGVAGGAGVEDFFSFWRDVAEGEEEVDV